MEAFLRLTNSKFKIIKKYKSKLLLLVFVVKIIKLFI